MVFLRLRWLGMVYSDILLSLWMKLIPRYFRNAVKKTLKICGVKLWIENFNISSHNLLHCPVCVSMGVLLPVSVTSSTKWWVLEVTDTVPFVYGLKYTLLNVSFHNHEHWYGACSSFAASFHSNLEHGCGDLHIQSQEHWWVQAPVWGLGGLGVQPVLQLQCSRSSQRCSAVLRSELCPVHLSSSTPTSANHIFMEFAVCEHRSTAMLEQVWSSSDGKL